MADIERVLGAAIARMLARELAMGLLLGLGLFQGDQLGLGQHQTLLGALGFQRLEPLDHGLEVVTLPDAAHPRGRHRQPALPQLVGDADLAEGRLLNSQFNDGVLDLLRHPVLQHRLLAADLLQRQLAALVLKLLEAVEAVAAVTHHLAGLADVAELLGELQKPDLGADDLLFSGHGVLQSAEAGRFATPTAPRPASACDSPGDQDTMCQVKFWLMHVTRVLSNDAGTRVIGVEYCDRNRERQVQEASVVVLAAWAAQNPRIMLNSATVKHANGLANSSGLVGKYMMTHFASGTFAIFDEDVENHMGTTGAQYMSYDRYDKTSHKDAFGSSFIVAGFALKTNDLGGFANARLDLFGPDLDAFMRRAARGLTRITAFGEELPNMENRLELIGDKDAFGMPLARLVHNYDKDVEAVWNANLEEGVKIAQAAGAKEVWSARGAIPTIHLMGGTTMGTNAGNSVVNSYGQAHEIPNLYVAEPGIFATAGASNPTYTIFALSLRGAEHLAANWKTLAG